MLTIQSIDKIMKEEQQQLQRRMAETLANMSDAFFIYRAIEHEHILWRTLASSWGRILPVPKWRSTTSS